MPAGLNRSATIRKLLRTASAVALAVACGTSSQALAATYLVGSEADLVNAINAANASGDASSTITFTRNVDVLGTTLLPLPTNSLTIDTNGFTLMGVRVAAPATAGSVRFDAPFASGTMSIAGSIRGADGTAAAAGSVGLVVDSGVTTAGSPAGQVVNNGSIKGGDSTAGTFSGGIGVSLLNVVTFINNGTITGGTGTGGGASNNGAGVNVLSSGATLINGASGTIQGGNNQASGIGAGVFVSGTAAKPGTVINYGTIRGGSDLSGVVSGAGAIVGRGVSTVSNYGTLIGGNGRAAVIVDGGGPLTWNLTLINAGTIQAGAGGANAITGSLSAAGSLVLELQAGSQIFGNVRGSATGTNDVLRLGGDTNWTLDGGIGSTSQYQNFDRLEKTGTSTWIVTGSGDFAGPTDVLAGKLVVNGSLASSSLVTVASGARLGGSGTVGATTIAAGGLIAPGNSIGTLTINGAYNQAAGATYQVELDPGTVTSDLIRVNGTATLAPGAGLSVVNYTGAAYSAGQRYTILTSTGLTGNYGADIAIGPILSLRNSTDATNAYLTVVQTGTAGGIGGTGNEIQTGNAVDSLPNGNGVQNGIYSQASIDAARRALNQVSGEIHASAKTALIEESWLLRSAINDRLRSAFGSVGATTLNYGYTADLSASARGPMPLPQAERFAVWGQGYGAWGHTDSDGNAARLKRSTGGFLIGADTAAFDNLRFGIVAGYSRSSFDVADRGSSGESDNYHLGLYGGGQWGALNLRAGASYTWHDLETARVVTSAFLGSAPRASYNAATAQIFGEAGYRIDLGRVAFEPFAGLAYVHLSTDGFNETGAATALAGWSDTSGIGYSTLGLRASTDLDLQGMDVKLRGGLAWRHAFGDIDPKTTMAFAGSSAFTIAGLPIARDAALVEAGLDVAVGRGTTFGVSYTGQLAQDAQDHAFKGLLAVRF